MSPPLNHYLWLKLRWFLSWASSIFSLQFSQMIHIPSFSRLLESPLHLQLHTHGFTHCPLRGTLLGLQAFFWNLGKSLPDPITLAFYIHPNPAPCGCCQGLMLGGAITRLPSLLAFGCLDNWAPWTKSQGRNFLGHCHSGIWCSGALFSEQILSPL